MTLTPEVHRILRRASYALPRRQFTCTMFPDHWNDFVQEWSPKIHAFVEEALGPYGTEPLPAILPLSDGFHMACANASFDLASGQIRLASHCFERPGVTLEKLTHEMLHGSMAAFPNDQSGFYSEGVIDYSTWILAHAPTWEPYRQEMIKAAADNIRTRRDRALRTGTDYDAKRWAGGLFAMTAYGPYIIARLRQRKAEGNLTW